MCCLFAIFWSGSFQQGAHFPLETIQTAKLRHLGNENFESGDSYIVLDMGWVALDVVDKCDKIINLFKLPLP